MKINEFVEDSKIDDNDIFIKDGTNGTTTVSFKTIRKTMDSGIETNIPLVGLGGHEPVAIKKNGMVHINLYGAWALLSDSNKAIITMDTVLPVDMRPIDNVRFPLFVGIAGGDGGAANGFALLVVNTDGTIKLTFDILKTDTIEKRYVMFGNISYPTLD